ncbi:MAG TPA: M14 family metallopeptidase, partial [Longimicrobiales bacterium]|nr:M14 family metallopeptidase [Longimicrobiales bacterium]
MPTPASVLGFAPGADFELATYEQSIAYFERLDAASDRISLVRTGRTSHGRDWTIALISSAENLAALERHREIARRLAEPTTLSDEEARALAREGRAIVDISGGLHASEVAGAQHTIGLAYEMVSSEDPRLAAIRENVILLLWPSLNPDGQTIVADWYRENLGTPYEVAPLPTLYQKYVGHDNNRDAYMLNMVESRVLTRTWQEWAPQIIYVHHQSSPFPTRIWLPPFAEPIAPRVPPLMSRTVNTIGMTIAQMLEARGMPGATHMGTGFDAWYPGYVDYLPMLQNQAAFWTETALYRYATPHFFTLDDFPEGRRDLRAESLYPSPWTGGWWRLGDAVRYMHVASLAVLDYAARYREDLLYNRYQSGRDVVARYRAGPPYAYFVPREQRDPVAPVELLRRLAYNGIRVQELTAPLDHQGRRHPAGTWVVPMDQPFAELARQVLEVQTYPDLREYPEGPPEQPYDAAGWTLGYQMDVRVIEATEPLPESAALRDVRAEPLAWDADVADASPFDLAPGVGFDDMPWAAGVRPSPGRITGSGGALLLDPAQNNSFRALNAAW